MCPHSTVVVEHLTHSPEIKSLNCFTKTGKNTMKKVHHLILWPSSTVVEHSAYKPNKGSNDSNGTGRKKMVKSIQFCVLVVQL